MKRLLVVTLLSLAACSGAPACPEPFYDGKASDEAWRTMLDGLGRATANEMKAVTLASPTDGAKLDATAPAPKFVWSTPLMASHHRLPAPRARASFLSRASDLVYSSAWAHLPPVTGPLHLLRLSVPGKACPIELLTTRTEWTPNDEAWRQLKDTVGKTLSLDVYSAYLQDNRISEGPFHFTRPQTVTVGP